MITEAQLNWVAGLIEGEGSFTHHRNGDLVISVAMTDGDVIGRLHSVFGFGTVRERRIPSGKTVYRWSSTHQANTAGLMMSLWSLMGKRRQQKIIECLEAWKKKPLRKGMWTYCKNGHELRGDNLIIAHEGKYEKRRCRECIKLRMRKHRAKKEKPVRAPRILPTQCKHGHELTGDNLRIGRDGKYEYRTCGECARLRQSKYRTKLRAVNDQRSSP